MKSIVRNDTPKYTIASDVLDHVDTTILALIEELEEDLERFPGEENKAIRHMLYRCVGYLKHIEEEISE